MQHIEKMWSNCFQYLKRYPLDDPSKWSLAHDMDGSRYGIMNTNLTESFNKILKGAHSLPISALVRLSFECLSKWFSVRHASVVRQTGRMFTNKIIRKLNRHQLKSREHDVVKYNEQPNLYKIRLRCKYYSPNEPDYTQTIDLREHTCTCRKWQLLHYACFYLFAIYANENLD